MPRLAVTGTVATGLVGVIGSGHVEGETKTKGELKTGW